jgi:1-acyl-sn-glycerol-3-phosphate acyltransferase
VYGALPQQPAVIVANHVSYVDPILLGALGPAAPIAKQEIAGWPLIGGGAAALGAMFVDRDRPSSGARVLRQALRALRAGVSVLGFPEGTTSPGHDVLAFRRGLPGLARLARVPIVPVAIRYHRADMAWTGSASLLPHYLRTAARAESLADVIIGEPIGADGRDARELADEMQARVARLLRS